MENEVTMVRIYVREADNVRSKNLMQEILALLRDKRRLTQVTVFRGIAGTGERGETRAADVLRVLVDLPLVVEFFDKPTIEAVLPILKQMLPSNRMVSRKASIG
jgi:PII-like signaling protein